MRDRSRRGWAEAPTSAAFSTTRLARGERTKLSLFSLSASRRADVATAALVDEARLVKLALGPADRGGARIESCRGFDVSRYYELPPPQPRDSR